MRAGSENPWATVASALVVLAASSGSVEPGPRAPSGGPTVLAITHVTVIDMAGAPPKPGMTVVTSGDRIAAIGPGDRQSLPENAVVVDHEEPMDLHRHHVLDDALY